MTALQLEPVRESAAAAEDFEIAYVTADGVECRLPLAEAWAVNLEDGLPVRRFASRKGQRHLSGLWWSSTMARHVGFESWLERDHAMLLDFDPAVVGVSSQPFRLHWRGESDKTVSHVPDYFARRADGSTLVMDCRPVERRRAADVARFEATARACDLVGWSYRLVGAVDTVEAANVRWLAGYRHPRHHLSGTAEALRVAFATPAPLITGAEGVGDPIAVLPVVFHLLWSHELIANLSVPLGDRTQVRSGGSR